MENNEISNQNAISESPEQTKRPRGRPPKNKAVESRAEQTKQRRRRRRDDDFTASGKRMHVDPALKDEKNWSYRWMNDEPGRLHDKTVHDDWEYVIDDGKSAEMTARNAPDHENQGLGTKVSRHVGVNPDGSSKHAYLMRKPRGFYEEDHAKRQRRIDEVDRQIRQGQTPPGGKDPGASDLPGDKTYVDNSPPSRR